jgi:hypothetical protein
VCALARDFLPEEDFTGRNLRQRGSKQWRKEMRQPNCTHITGFSPWKYAGAYLPVKLYFCEHARAASVENAPFFTALAWRAKHARANSSPWNPPPGGNPGLKRTRIGAIFKKFVVKTTFQLKINVKRNPLKFKSIQWNYLQAFPIWWDYPFNRMVGAGAA